MKVELTEGKFLETSKNYIEVALEGYGQLATVNIDNFTEIGVSLIYGNGIVMGIKCEFGKVEYETVFVRQMSKGVKIDYDLLQSVVLNRLHLILNERFFPMDYVKKSILGVKSDCFGKDTIVLNLPHLISNAFDYCAEEFSRAEEEEQNKAFWIKVGEEIVNAKKESKKESKKVVKDKSKKENKKNKNKKDKE